MNREGFPWVGMDSGEVLTLTLAGFNAHEIATVAGVPDDVGEFMRNQSLEVGTDSAAGAGRMTAVAKKAAKRARRPIYLQVARLIDPATGAEVGCLVPANMIDQRLMRERRFTMGKEIRAELKQSRNPQFHRLAHAVGNLLADNVDAFAGKSGHEALKAAQVESGVCCDLVELDLGPLGKVPVKQPRSLAFDEMDEADFKAFFEGITQYIGDNFAHVMLDEVRAEYWLMVSGEAA